MYKKIFDHGVQKELEGFFINDLSEHGFIKNVKKGEIINPDNSDNIYIIFEGEFNQLMYSKDGDEIIFFRITKGSIFGEEDFFDERRTRIVYKALKNSKVSILNRNIIEGKLLENSSIYNYFIKSMIIKQRMTMMEISNYKFNDSMGKLADFLIRLYYTEDINMEFKKYISIILTHEEIANRIGLNRATVTKIIKNFKEKNYIKLNGREIIINDIEGLKKLTNIPI